MSQVWGVYNLCTPLSNPQEQGEEDARTSPLRGLKICFLKWCNLPFLNDSMLANIPILKWVFCTWTSLQIYLILKWQFQTRTGLLIYLFSKLSTIFSRTRILIDNHIFYRRTSRRGHATSCIDTLDVKCIVHSRRTQLFTNTML